MVNVNKTFPSLIIIVKKEKKIFVITNTTIH